MSQHPSFGGKGKIKAKRNVLKRYERLRALQANDKWREGDSVFGLPKSKGEE